MFEARKYTPMEEQDIYGSRIHQGDLHAEFYEAGEVVHLDNIFEYMLERHGDLYIQSIDLDSELIDYLKKNYDCEVYKK